MTPASRATTRSATGTEANGKYALEQTAGRPLELAGHRVTPPPTRRLNEALRREFGHRRLPARAGRGGGGRAGRARRAARDADRRRQVALLPAPRAASDRLAVVVSPLVSLMTDQVERLGGARRADQRPARRHGQPAGARAGAGRQVRMLYVAPERFATPGFIERLRRRGRRPLRRRRGALREPVGPRLPPRLLPARRGRAQPRCPLDLRRDRDRHAAGRRRCPATARADASGPDHDRLRPAEPLLRRGPGGLGAGEAGGDLGAAARAAARCRRSSTQAPARRPTRRRRASSRELGRAVPAYHAGMERDPRAESSEPSWPARHRSSSRRTRSAWASTRPTSGP